MGATLAPQQAELYAAEDEALNGHGRRWRRIADAQAYVDALLESEWFVQRWPHMVRCVVERRGHGSRWSTQQRLDADGADGAATEGAVLIADGALIEPVVLHELAHLLTPRGTGHGPLFAETLLTLVRHQMGFFAFAEYYYALRRRPSFRDIREGTG